MANNPVVSTLTFTGNVAGQATISAQGIAGNLTFLLPNTSPIQGQLLDVQSVNGNNVFLGWVSPQSTSISLSQILQSGATTGQIIEWNGTAWVPSTTVPGSGTVTSVALTAPVEFTVGGSPITGAGTLAITKATQSANTVWAGPTTGVAAAPTFRALVIADIPSLAASNLSNGTTGSGPIVLETSPTISTPSISGAVVLNGVTISATAPTSGQVLLASSSSAAAWGTLSFSQLGGSLAVAQINSKQGNGNAVQLTNTGATTTGDIVTYDANSNVVDSGTALASLALLASPSFTGTVTLPAVTQNGTITGGASGIVISDTSAAGVTIHETGAGNLTLIDGASAMQLTPTAASLGANNGSFSVNASGALSITPAVGQITTISNHVSIEGVTSTGATGTGNIVFSAAPTFTGTVTIANAHITGTLADGTNSVGTSGQVLSSTVTGTAWVSDNDLTSMDGAGNPVVLQGDNHLASGAATLTTGTVTVTLTGASVYSASGVYQVQVTRTNTPGGAGTGLLWVTNTSGSVFVIHSTDATDSTSTLAWTAIGF